MFGDGKVMDPRVNQMLLLPALAQLLWVFFCKGFQWHDYHAAAGMGNIIRDVRKKIDIKLYPLVTLKIHPSFETLAINGKLRSNKKGVI